VIFTLGDVSDKGVASALFMVRVVTLLHWLAPTHDHPSALLASLNQALCLDNEAGMFVTLGCALADLDKGEILYASGGHEAPLLVTPGQPAAQLAIVGGPALGLYRDSTFPSHCFRLKRGQSLVLLSDGVTEANDAATQEFGSQRLLECLGFLPDCGPARVVDLCVQAVEGFMAGTELSDDLTLLAFQPATSQCHQWTIPCQMESLMEFTKSLHRGLLEAGCTEECLHDLDLVTEELLVNTISHGFPSGSEDSLIEIALRADAYQVHLVLRDNGIPFNPLEAAEREEDKIGGWGIPLIKAMNRTLLLVTTPSAPVEKSSCHSPLVVKADLSGWAISNSYSSLDISSSREQRSPMTWSRGIPRLSA
jgi:sigma-B regulation protein RsbU (phosphoserine phosphatase)